MSRRLIVFLLFFMAGSVLAHAGRIEISEPQCEDGDTAVTSLTNGFAVIPNLNGGGTFHFCNETGQDWSNIVIGILTTAPISDIQCPSSSPSDPQNNEHLAFSTCVLFPSNSIANLIYAYFFGVSPPIPQFGFNGFPGVPDGQRFTVDLDCHDFGGCIPWPTGTIMLASENVGPNDPLPTPVPEPASLTLLASGGVAAYLRRKRKL